jgi:pre-60S factor REI1
MYQKLNDSKLKVNESTTESNVGTSLVCDVCKKSFSSRNKFQEHMISRSHKKNQEIADSMPKVEKKVSKNFEEEKTTKDDITICLFCNLKNSDVESNVIHMINGHKFEVPFILCVKNLKGMLRLIAKKIFTYVACLTCDSQNFKNYKSLQNHMIDKQHTTVNSEDLEEFLFKFYDSKRLLANKDRNVRKSKEFKILKIKLNVEAKKEKKKKIAKTENEEESDGWETVSEDENKANPRLSKLLEKDLQESDEDDEFEPIELPNGELLLENGTIVGNKLYQLVYKQRIRINPFQKIADSLRVLRRKNLKKKLVKSKKMAHIDRPKYFNFSTSNKSSFIRVNTLFKACKQVNV